MFYTQNCGTRGWMGDVRPFLLGPPEVTIATEFDPQPIVRKIIEGGTVPHAH